MINGTSPRVGVEFLATDRAPSITATRSMSSARHMTDRAPTAARIFSAALPEPFFRPPLPDGAAAAAALAQSLRRGSERLRGKLQRPATGLAHCGDDHPALAAAAAAVVAAAVAAVAARTRRRAQAQRAEQRRQPRRRLRILRRGAHSASCLISISD